MERQCVALADVVLSPSQYMLRWMQSRGWTLPAVCYVQQNIPLPELKTSGRVTIRGEGEQRASELVFFGKLEERKGIGLFCDALDLRAGRNLRGFSVTFLERARGSRGATRSATLERARNVGLFPIVPSRIAAVKQRCDTFRKAPTGLRLFRLWKTTCPTPWRSVSRGIPVSCQPHGRHSRTHRRS